MRTPHCLAYRSSLESASVVFVSPREPHSAQPSMRYPLIVVALSLASLADAHAQSCAAADSLVGAKVEKKAFARVGAAAYDKMTDTTRLVGSEAKNATLIGARLITTFPGQSFRAVDATTVLRFQYALQGSGGMLGNKNQQQLTLQNAAFSNVDVALFLINDSLRVRLPRARYTPRLEAAGVMFPQYLWETLEFSVPVELLLQIGSATSGMIRVGDVPMKFNKDFQASARETARLYLCGEPTK
ncbi:MAG: hypothetical protein ACYC1W_09685 [Gemmatimonadaceae bacterium]